MDILRRGRLSTDIDEEVLCFSSSMEADERVFHADIEVDKAHVVMLREQGIINEEQCSAILSALDRIKKEGILALDSSYEDVHIAIEARLIQLIGEDTGGRMHSGRSRNDEVATCIRITLRHELICLMDELHSLITTLVNIASKHCETLIPGYTHLQHAQPTTLAHHLLAHAHAFMRDLERIMDAYKRTNQNPLGAVAFASTSFSINRERTTQLLGFASIMENSMDAVSTRDFMIESLSCAANLMTNLSRIAEEIILWSCSEFDFIELSDRYTSTSSVMPQKKNPDIAELIRGKTGSVYGALMSVLAICKSLPYSYNRDLQEATPHIWKGMEIARLSIHMTQGMLSTMKIKKENMKKALNMGFTAASELADTMVRTTGISFRTAHYIVGTLAKTGKTPTLSEIDELSLNIIGEKLSDKGLSEESIKKALDPMEIIRKRDISGATSPKEVQRQITVLKKKLEDTQHRIRLIHNNITKASEELEKICEQYKQKNL